MTSFVFDELHQPIMTLLLLSSWLLAEWIKRFLLGHSFMVNVGTEATGGEVV